MGGGGACRVKGILPPLTEYDLDSPLTETESPNVPIICMHVTDWQPCSDLAGSGTAIALYYQNHFHLQTAMGDLGDHTQRLSRSHCRCHCR